MFPDKLNILLIEDNPADCTFLKTVLAEENQIYIKTAWQKTLESGLEYCHDEKNEIDIVLLDLNLPDSKGLDTVKRFCKTIPDYPVIVLSHNDDFELAIKSLSLGVQDFLLKGEFELSLIRKAIIYAIERHRQKFRDEDNKESVRQFESKLKTIIENDLDGILIIDSNGVIKFSNPTVAEILGISSRELKGKTFGIPVLGENNMAEIEIYVSPTFTKNAELQMTDINWQGTDVFLCTIRDITVQRIKEREVQENEEKFMAVARNSSDAIVQLDDQKNIVFVNSVAEKTFGFNSKDVLKIGFDYVFKNNPELIKIVNTIGDKTAKKSHLEIIGFRKNEDSFPMEVTLSTFKRKGRHQIVCSMRETTERKRAETDLHKTRKQLEDTLDVLKSNRQKLVEVEKLKSVRELAGGISHEFAQPLQALYNYLHLIQNVEAKEEYFQKTREMLNRISDLTTNLKSITSLQKMDYLESKIIDLFASSERPSKFSGLKILVVDDEREILETMIDIFKNAGYNCKGATDGQEAFELIQNEQFDLVLCDVMMPRMSGVDLLRQIRKMKYKTRFIFLTGYEIPEEYNEISHQADYIISKPISFNELVTYVDKALQN